MYYTPGANPVSECGDLATLARGRHVCKSFVSYPRDMDASIGILRACRENLHDKFYCGVCATLIFC